MTPRLQPSPVPTARRLLRWLAGAFLPLVLLCPAPASFADHNQVLELHQRGEILSLTSLIERAQAIHPGQMVEAELDNESLVYEITVYGNDDRYHEMYFDARSGALLTDREETDEESEEPFHHDRETLE